MTQFDKCCGMSEESKLQIFTCICTCHPTLKKMSCLPQMHVCSIPPKQPEVPYKLKFLCARRHFFGEKNGATERWHMRYYTGQRTEHRAKDGNVRVSVKDH